jgi:hypothetical protein
MRGHNILSDDVLAVQLNGAGAGAWLSMSQLNVWPPTAAACLGEGWQSLPRLAEGTEKRALRTDGVSPLTPLPLRCIYVLDVGESISAEPIGVRAACLELLRHTYAAGLLRAMGVAGDNLRQCGQLAQRVPVYRLRRPFRLESLPDVAQWLEEQCGL